MKYQSKHLRVLIADSRFRQDKNKQLKKKLKRLN